MWTWPRPLQKRADTVFCGSVGNIRWTLFGVLIHNHGLSLPPRARLDQLDRFGFPRDYAAKCLPAWRLWTNQLWTKVDSHSALGQGDGKTQSCHNHIPPPAGEEETFWWLLEGGWKKGWLAINVLRCQALDQNLHAGFEVGKTIIQRYHVNLNRIHFHPLGHEKWWVKRCEQCAGFCSGPVEWWDRSASWAHTFTLSGEVRWMPPVLGATAALRCCGPRFGSHNGPKLTETARTVVKRVLKTIRQKKGSWSTTSLSNFTILLLTGFAHRRCRQGERIKEREACDARARARARARAEVTFCQHARPVNWCKTMIKSQEKNAWKPCKNQCFSSVAFTKPCKYQ